MRQLNGWITLGLAAAAGLAWFLFAIIPGQFLLAWPGVQIPLAITLSAAACLGWLLLFLQERRRDGECRCRRCHYILRGLSEPRCPECGERI